MDDLQLGNKKPSQLLREMRRLANNILSDEFLKTLWLRRLPTVIQGILAVSEKPDLTTLSQVADNLVETTMLTNNNNNLVMATNFDSIGKIGNTPSHPWEVRVSTLERVLSDFITESRNSIKDITNTIKKNRSRSQSNLRNNNNFNSNVGSNTKVPNKFCMYHAKYGIKAHRCNSPCDWVDSRTGNE